MARFVRRITTRRLIKSRVRRDRVSCRNKGNLNHPTASQPTPPYICARDLCPTAIKCRSSLRARTHKQTTLANDPLPLMLRLQTEHPTNDILCTAARYSGRRRVYYIQRLCTRPYIYTCMYIYVYMCMYIKYAPIHMDLVEDDKIWIHLESELCVCVCIGPVRGGVS